MDLSATPKGWLPVDYGLAQISIPANWQVLYDTAICDPQPPGVVEVGPVTNLPGCAPAPSPKLVPTAMITPLGHANPIGGKLLVNGIRVFVSPVSDVQLLVYDVPSLGVQVSARGPLARRVLSTLTYSPRAVVLAGRSFSSVPSSWHWFTFAGIRFAAPSGWRRKATKQTGFGCGIPGLSSMRESVILSTDTSFVVWHCATVIPELAPSTTGLRVDAIASRAIPTPTGMSTDCMQIHGLTACPYTNPDVGVLYLRVSGPRLPHQVMFEVGLAGDGSVAREILGSMQAA